MKYYIFGRTGVANADIAAGGLRRFLVLLLTFMTAAASAQAARAAGPPRINDQANFFSEPARQQADDVIADIFQKYGKQVVIETFPTIPADVQDAARGESRDELFRQWLVQRAKALKVNGVYILICKDPSHLQLDAGKFTKEKLFTADNCKMLSDALVEQFHNKQFDAGLLDAVKVIRDTMQTNSGGVPPGPEAPPVPPDAQWPATKPATKPSTLPAGLDSCVNVRQEIARGDLGTFSRQS